MKTGKVIEFVDEEIERLQERDRPAARLQAGRSPARALRRPARRQGCRDDGEKSYAEAAQKRLFIKTYGCQMNVYDSERMADVLRPLGYAVTDAAEDADLVVLNTCHIREKATEKVYSELGRITRLKAAARAAGGR